MVKIEELVGKTDAELKLFLKEVMYDQTKVFDWLDFFSIYVELGKNNFELLAIKFNEVFFDGNGYDIDDFGYYFRKLFSIYDIDLNTNLDINIFNNKLNIKFIIDQKEFNYSTYEKKDINIFLDFIFTNMKEIIKSISKSNLNEITDFFGDITLDKNNRKYDLEIKNDLL